MTVVFYTETGPLMNDTVFNAHIRNIPDFRQNKIKRLKLRNDKNLSLGAWLVLDKALNKFNCKLSHAGFEYDKNGKPFLSNHPDLHISISHSDSISLCAVSDNPIGADLECIGQFNEKLCRRFFRKKEQDYIFSSNNINTRTERFFRIWVLKESFVKYTGRGISEFPDFEIDISGDSVSINHKNKILPCCFSEPFIEGYKTAICTPEEDEIIFERINIIKGLLE